MVMEKASDTAHPQDAPEPQMRQHQRLQLLVAMQLSLTRHKKLSRGHKEMPTVIGNRPLVPQGLRIMYWQQRRPRKGQDLEGGQLGSPVFMHKS
jgi:hypothetical protein